MRSFADLARTLHTKLAPQFPKMLPEFEKNMKDSSSYDIILDTLTILRRLFRSKEDIPDFSAFFPHYEKILNIIL